MPLDKADLNLSGSRRRYTSTAGLLPDGYIQIVDRAKDVIKSGGEWISSVELENALMAHDDVSVATVIGVPHERWQERPVAFVVPVEGVDVADLEDELADVVQVLSLGMV